MKRSVINCWFMVIALLCNPAAFADDKKPAEAKEPPSIVASDLKPDLNGKEITMTVEIHEISPIEGSEPNGGLSSIRIQPATDVLLKMLDAKKLVMIIDDARKTATITSLPVANRRKPRPVLLEALAKK
jgi:hypothetical protein